MKKAFKAATIYTGTDVLNNHAIVVDSCIIHSIIPSVALHDDIPYTDYGTASITAPFIDLQIYGAFGNLLAVNPTPQTLSDTYRYCLEGGAAYFLPTVATNTFSVFEQCIDAVQQYWQQGGKGVMGLHVEGPWINPLKKGAHVTEAIEKPAVDAVKRLLDRGKDIIKIITLAPELCSKEIFDLIRSYGVIISAGHSNASFNEAMYAFDNGVTAATHLFNAMSGLMHREPGMVGACFEHSSVKASIIADGWHVDFNAIKIAKRIMGDRLFAITDAVTETSSGYYQHAFKEDHYEANGVLSGSALTMMKSAKNLHEKAGISKEEALRMCNLYPAKLIGRHDEMGLLKKNYPAEFIVFDDEWNVIDRILH